MTKPMTMAEIVDRHAYYGEWPKFRTLRPDVPWIAGAKEKPDMLDAQEWLRSARPGAAAVYFKGASLTTVCEDELTTKRPHERPTLYLAGFLWAEAMYDRVDLVQRKVAKGLYEYIVIKRVKPPASSMRGAQDA